MNREMIEEFIQEKLHEIWDCMKHSTDTDIRNSNSLYLGVVGPDETSSRTFFTAFSIIDEDPITGMNIYSIHTDSWMEETDV